MQHREQRSHTTWHHRTLGRRGRRKAHPYRGWEHRKETDIRATTSSGRGYTRYRSRAHTHLEGVAGRQPLRQYRIRTPGIACMRRTTPNAELSLVMHGHKAINARKRHTSKEGREQSRKWRWSSQQDKSGVAGGNTTGPGLIKHHHHNYTTTLLHHTIPPQPRILETSRGCTSGEGWTQPAPT